MTQILGRGVALQMRAAGNPLYDVHSLRLASLEEGGDLGGAFLSAFLGRLFGVPPGEWRSTFGRVLQEMRGMSPGERDAYLAARRPVRSLSAAADYALAVYPSAEAHLLPGSGAAPFELRRESLFQPNVAIERLLWRRKDGGTAPLLEIGSGGVAPREVRRQILAITGSGAEGEADELAAAADRFGLLEPAGKSPSRPPPGVYATGHSSLLVLGERGGILFDPHLSSAYSAAVDGFVPSDLLPFVDAVALTHSHFDHYHLPTLLALSEKPILVFEVPAPSVICEDVPARLREFGADVRVVPWGESLEIADLRLHALPFRGEQFDVPELHPGVRNHGNTWVVEGPGGRAMVVVDSGFEKEESVFDVVDRFVASHGRIDVLATQAIGLTSCFGIGDPDIQLAALLCLANAEEAFERARPERRCTLDPTDLPDLCRRSGARTVLLHGQFAFARGKDSVRPELVRRASELLYGLAAVPVVPVGGGVPFGGVEGSVERAPLSL